MTFVVGSGSLFVVDRNSLSIAHPADVPISPAPVLYDPRTSAPPRRLVSEDALNERMCIQEVYF
jgi:hypothetical protein